MTNGNDGNQFREDEIIILEQLRDGKMVKNIFPKIGGRLRLAHEENDQLSIATEIIKYEENPAMVLASETALRANSLSLGMGKIGKDLRLGKGFAQQGFLDVQRVAGGTLIAGKLSVPIGDG